MTCRARAVLTGRRLTGAVVVLVSLMLTSSTQAQGFGDQWYIGVGGTASWLLPSPDDPSLDLTSGQGTGGSVLFGADIDSRSSAQLTFYALGEAELDNDETVPYYAADASILYRFFDSRDRRLDGGVFGASFYGRFGLGFLQRDTDIDLNNDARGYFGAGAGVEVYLSRSVALRAEGFYHESDAASANLSLVARFGSTRAQPAVFPTPASTPPTGPSSGATQDRQATPSPVPAPAADPISSDSDADGVADANDQCADSAAGYPVRDDGCPLFDGVLSGVKFKAGTAELLPEAFQQLDYLASLLKRYPTARIEVLAHTDNQGDVREQSIVTRARLKSLGTYLVQQGVRANRMVLRSFGGTRPLYDNDTVDGRERNNRIEIIEYRQ